MKSPYRIYKTWVILHDANRKDKKWIATKFQLLEADDLQSLKIKIDEEQQYP